LTPGYSLGQNGSFVITVSKTPKPIAPLAKDAMMGIKSFGKAYDAHERFGRWIDWNHGLREPDMYAEAKV
jgi:hypothetical protein